MHRYLALLALASCTVQGPHESELTSPVTTISIDLGTRRTNTYFTRDMGGDVDVTKVYAGGSYAVQTGNGAVLPSPDGNTVPDHFVQLEVNDKYIFDGSPTTSLKLDIVYFDQGTDTFRVQYDGTGGLFTETYVTHKTDTGTYKTATYVFKDAYFGNRDNGADFRIDDDADGAEIIKSVALTRLPVAHTIYVDSCGANPYDSLPDSDRIQACIDNAVDGDTIVFTSAGDPSYRGYLIDKTIFLQSKTPVHSYLTFTSTNPANHAQLRATPSLKGFVVRLAARSRIDPVSLGNLDYIQFEHLDVDGDRADRVCAGADGIENGLDDSWGAWLPECTSFDDSWCAAGGIAMVGSRDVDGQDYMAHPDWWTMGMLVDDVNITNTECATALGMIGAASRISHVTVTTAGDHVHGAGCASTDPDEPVGGWSDGLTLEGPSLTIDSNTITDASDVGMVFFGGRELVAVNNTVHATPGNHGMFAGIALHPWGYGDIGGTVIASNLVYNEGDTTCGGIHAGIDIGPHMWGGGCDGGVATADGTSGCVDEPTPPGGTACVAGTTCQKWAYVPLGSKLILQNNNSVQPYISYLIEGLDLSGTLVDTGNLASNWEPTDWVAPVAGCPPIMGPPTTWPPMAKVAHHPSLAAYGYTDVRVHCER